MFNFIDVLSSSFIGATQLRPKWVLLMPTIATIWVLTVFWSQIEMDSFFFHFWNLNLLQILTWAKFAAWDLSLPIREMLERYAVKYTLICRWSFSSVGFLNLRLWLYRRLLWNSLGDCSVFIHNISWKWVLYFDWGSFMMGAKILNLIVKCIWTSLLTW